MKKLIYSLSFAMAFGLAANAASLNAERMQFNGSAKIELSDLQSSYLELTRVDNGTSRKVKRDAPINPEDLVGQYLWSGNSHLTGPSPAAGSLSITLMPGSTTEFILTGMPYDDAALQAHWDAEKQRLNIPSQLAFVAEDGNAWFYDWSIEYDENGSQGPGYYIMPAPESTFYFTVTDTGLMAGSPRDPEKWNNNSYTQAELLDTFCIGSVMPEGYPDGSQGYYWLCSWIECEDLVFFNYVADEWVKLGECVFKDAWFPLFWENGQTPEYPVDIYYSKNDPGNYLLYNPYGIVGDEENPYSYYEINVGTKPSFLIFDMNDFDCVRFRPLVASIYLDDREEEDDEPLPEPYYCFNYEGYYSFLQGSTTDEIIINFEQNELDISYFDSRSNTVNIYNAVFGIPSSPVSTYNWNNYEDLMVGSVKLPDNWADGVDAVMGEDVDAPAVYYNLQGVRVNNPEKGQLLIVKKGNKTSKQIVR